MVLPQSKWLTPRRQDAKMPSPSLLLCVLASWREPIRRLRAADLNLSRFGLLHLGQMNGQHTVLELGADLRGVDRFVNLERPIEVADFIFLKQRSALHLTRLDAAMQCQFALFVA